MKKTNNAIVFAQAQDNNKAVVATRNGNECYLAHALYEKNKTLIDELGGTRRTGVKYFCVDFKTVKNAKAFIADAHTELSDKEYNATRKANDKAKANDKPKTQAKGNDKMITLTDAEGNEYRVPASALQAKGNKKTTRKGKGNVEPTPTKTSTSKQTKKTATKGKGNAELTDAGKNALERMKASVLNRAASAYSVANGGEATTFKALGKTEKQLSAYLPKAKADLLKSDKWAKASKTHGLTAEMLG